MVSADLIGKKILVSGASGFIGSHLCRRLGQTGAEVHGVSREKRPALEQGIRWWRGDLAEITTVRELISAIRPDVIFHLAGHVTGARGVDFVLSTFHWILATTVNVLVAATEIGCRRVILAGSLEEPERSETEATPASPYAAAKFASSAYARMFHGLYRTPVVIARIFMVYGPDQKDLQKLIPYVIRSLLKGESPQLSSGQREVDWIYVDDVVEGLLALAQAANIEGRTIDLGSGTLVPVRTIVEHLFRIIGSKDRPRFGTLAERPMEQVRVADTIETYAKIRWRSTVPLERGLARTVNWYRSRFMPSYAVARKDC